MIDQGADLSVTRQCELLDLNRSGVYYTPRPISEEDLRLMRRVDELHLEHPFYGARRLAKQLEREGFDVGRLHVTTLMRRMGIEALYRRPRTSIPARDAKIYPYLLEGMGMLSLGESESSSASAAADRRHSCRCFNRGWRGRSDTSRRPGRGCRCFGRGRWRSFGGGTRPCDRG